MANVTRDRLASHNTQLSRLRCVAPNSSSVCAVTLSRSDPTACCLALATVICPAVRPFYLYRRSLGPLLWQPYHGACWGTLAWRSLYWASVHPLWVASSRSVYADALAIPCNDSTQLKLITCPPLPGVDYQIAGWGILPLAVIALLASCCFQSLAYTYLAAWQSTWVQFRLKA